MPNSLHIHFSASLQDRPGARQQIRAALRRASGPRQPEGDHYVPAWVVTYDRLEDREVYIAHHTASQFTLAAPSADALCEQVGEAMSDDTRYRSSSFRLDGRPDTRRDRGPDQRERSEARESNTDASGQG